MRNAVLVSSVLLAIAAGVACSSSTSAEPVEDAEDGGGGTGPSSPAPQSNAPEGPAGTGLATGLPCDVQMVVENRCLACHGGTNPAPLRTYDDFMKKSTVDPSKTLAQMSLIRMQSKTSPMPPPPAVPPEADEIQAFADWVNAGSPKGKACTDPPPDGGSPPATDGGATDGGAEGGADGGTGVVCTSNKTWTGGNNGSPLMRPGEACNACHQVMGGPNLRIAGTVYPTLHEPNLCYGKAPPPQLTVTIVDAKNRVVSMPVNEAGNFFTRTGVSAPFKASVTDGTKTRAMAGSITSGDCNSCHTVAGLNGAPGRIQAP